MYSERLKKKAADKTEGLIRAIHPLVTTKNYKLLDEYLYKSSAIGSDATIFKSINEDNDYKINFKVYSSETYISLISYTEPLSQWLFTAIYGKYNSEWKLDVILIAQYTVLNKNYVDLYKQAKKDYLNGDFIGAINYMLASKMVSTPAGSDLIYFKTQEIENFRDKINKEISTKVKLPFVISEMKTSPQIFGIQPIVNMKGVFPSVNYLTKINLKDTISLKAENEEIKKMIGRIYPNIDKNKKYIFFKAYNQIPEEGTPMAHYEFTLKTE